MGCQRPGKSLPIVACGGGDDAHQGIAIRVLYITGVSNPDHTELQSHLVRQHFREFDFEPGKAASIGEVRIRECGWVSAEAQDTILPHLCQ
jgi:hypothetical protein